MLRAVQNGTAKYVNKYTLKQQKGKPENAHAQISLRMPQIRVQIPKRIIERLTRKTRSQSNVVEIWGMFGRRSPDHFADVGKMIKKTKIKGGLCPPSRAYVRARVYIVFLFLFL